MCFRVDERYVFFHFCDGVRRDVGGRGEQPDRSQGLAMDALGNVLRKRRYALWTTAYKGVRSDAGRRACVSFFFFTSCMLGLR